MKAGRLFLISLATLLAGCGSYPYNGTYGLLVVGNSAEEHMHRAVSKHVRARVGSRLDDFEQTIMEAEHENGVGYVALEATNGFWQFQYQGKYTFYCGTFVREEVSPLESAPVFAAEEIREPAVLAAKVKSGSDPVSSWLFSRFSENGLTALAGTHARPEEMEAVFAHELNAIVYGPPIYDETRFRQVSLRTQTKRQIELRSRFHPSSGELAIFEANFNRALLEDAYPHELAKKQTIPWTHHYIAVR